MAMNAEEFDAWAQARRDDADRAHAKPIVLMSAILARLNANLFTSDKAILSAPYCLTTFESPKVGDPGVVDADGNHFPETKKYIHTLLTLLYGRPEVAAKLHIRLAYLSGVDNHRQEQEDEYQTGIALLAKMGFDDDVTKMQSEVELAETYYANNKKKEADAMFEQALSYDWYKVTDPDTFDRLRSLYIRAGHGLILARQGDLAGLKNIYFVESVNDELQPDLQSAIADAIANASPPAKASAAKGNETARPAALGAASPDTPPPAETTAQDQPATDGPPPPGAAADRAASTGVSPQTPGSH